MNRKFISSGAFAAVAAIVAASSFISCSSEDEYYENGNYTLANKRMTRSSIEGEDMPVNPPDITLSYSSGNTDYEVIFDGLHILFNVSWGGGNWRDMTINVSLSSVENMGGYQEYWDEWDVYHRVNNIEYCAIQWETKAQVHDDKIYIPDMRIKYRKYVKFDLPNGETGYRMGEEQTSLLNFNVDISSYRIDY